MGVKLLLGFLGPVGAMIDVATESAETISDMVKHTLKQMTRKQKTIHFLIYLILMMDSRI